MKCSVCGGRHPEVEAAHHAARLAVMREDGTPRKVTPPRSVKVPDDLWSAAKAKAAERGETVTDVILRALTRYVRR